MSWHLSISRILYPTHLWFGSIKRGYYGVVQWWPTEGSTPGIGFIWKHRHWAWGLHRRTP